MNSIYIPLVNSVAPIFCIFWHKSAKVPYYIYAKVVSKEAVQNSNSISLRTNFSNIALTHKFYLRWMIHTYFLKMDANDGFYIHKPVGKPVQLPVFGVINHQQSAGNNHSG